MLKMTVDSLEAVEEPMRALYEEADGKFRLKVEGVEDASGLKSALEKERRDRAAAEKAAKAYASLGKTPDEIAAMVEASRKADEEKLSKAGEWDKLREQMNTAHAAALAEKDRVLAAKDKSLERFLIDGEATKAIAAAKGAAELLLPHVQRHVRMVEEDGNYTVLVVDAKGDPRVNAKGEPLTIADLVGELRKSDIYGRAFDGSGHSGSGTQPGGVGGGGGGKTLTRAAFEALSGTERAARINGGYTVTD